MKKSEIEPVLEALKKVPVAKIKDGDLKKGVINSFMDLLSEQRKLQEKKSDLQTMFLSQHKDEQVEVAKLYKQLRSEKDPEKRASIASEFEKHGDCILAAEALAVELKKLGEEPVSIASFDGEQFVAAYTEMEECDLSVIADLYPLFNKKEEEKCQEEV